MLLTEAFFETGSEGICYQLYDTSKEGYDGIVPLSDGDQLTIFNKEGGIAFCGIINKDRKTNREIYHYYKKYLGDLEGFRKKLFEINGCKDLDPLDEFDYGCHYCYVEIPEMSHQDLLDYLYEYHSQQLVNGMWVHWVQKGISPEYWDRLFKENFRAEVIPA